MINFTLCVLIFKNRCLGLNVQFNLIIRANKLTTSHAGKNSILSGHKMHYCHKFMALRPPICTTTAINKTKNSRIDILCSPLKYN